MYVCVVVEYVQCEPKCVCEYTKKVAYKTRALPSHKLQVGSFSPPPPSLRPENGITQKSALEGNEITLSPNLIHLARLQNTGIHTRVRGGRYQPFVFVINRPKGVGRQVNYQ